MKYIIKYKSKFDSNDTINPGTGCLLYSKDRQVIIGVLNSNHCIKVSKENDFFIKLVNGSKAVIRSYQYDNLNLLPDDEIFELTSDEILKHLILRSL